jgi:RNA polymerase sigma factor (sigma-70 family)
LSFGLLLLLSCRLFLRLGSLPGVTGALVLATAVWAVVVVGLLLFRFSMGGLSLSWRLARFSPFGAGLLTVGALGCVGVMFTLGAVVEELASQARALPASRLDFTCHASSMECTRRFFLTANGGQTPALPEARQAPALAAGVSTASWSYPEASSGGGSLDSESARSRRLRDCLDSQYKNRDMLERAWRIVVARVGEADAADIVHTVLISVCLNSETYIDFERFFLRSIDNGVNSWLRRPGNARTCSIELAPEPVCELDPDDAYVRGETQLVVRDVLCSLGEADRQVLVMRYFDELDEQEIARQLGIGYDAARKRLQRARERFMAEFRQRCQ